MLYLFKNIYLELDCYTDYGNKRIIVSKNGIENIPGDNNQLHYIDKIENIGSFFEYISKLAKKESNTWIYADTDSYLEIASIWLMNLLPNANNSDIYIFIKSQLIREKYFNPRPVDFVFFPIDIDSFYEKDIEKYTKNYSSNYISDLAYNNKESLPIEFLLCSYLYNNTYKEELKRSIKPLMIQDIEKYLNEIKEILIIHPMKKSFQQKLKLKTVYDIYNIEKYFSDDNELVKIWFDNRIWYSKYETAFKNSKPKVKIHNITKSDISALKDASLQCGLEWVEEGIYSIIKSDIHKMDFIPMLQKEIMSDEDLNTIIKFELQMDHSAGSFYNLDNSKTNIHFIEHILQSYKEKNLENIRPYILR